jgi:hypothetical protein
LPKINKPVLLIIPISLVAMVACAFLLTAVFGPSDNGLRCSRSSGIAGCQVFQTRFFGLFGNSSFTIPESSIRGAKGICATSKVGGRGGPSCNVYLTLDSGQDYPVLSYPFESPAEASAKKLNAYFADKSAPSIAIGEDRTTPWLVSGGVPLLFVTVILGLRWWRLRHRP